MEIPVLSPLFEGASINKKTKQKTKTVLTWRRAIETTCPPVVTQEKQATNSQHCYTRFTKLY